MTTMRVLTRLAVGLLLVAGTARSQDPPAPSTVAEAIVVSDLSWRVGSAEQPGWKTDDFKEEGWKAPSGHRGGWEAHYSTLNMFGFVSTAKPIWHPDNSQHVYFRKRFTAPERIVRAEIAFLADDNAEVYLNGELVDTYDTRKPYLWGHKGCAALVDLIPFIREGENILAVHVEDENGGYSGGFVADLRINAAPLVPPLKAVPVAEALSPELEERVLALLLQIEEGGYEERARAADEVKTLVEKHGAAMRARLKAYLEEGSEEARYRLGPLVNLEANLPDLGFPAGTDHRFAYCAGGIGEFGHFFSRPPEDHFILYKFVMAARVLAQENEEGVAEIARSMIKLDTDVAWERGVRIISHVELRSLMSLLEEAVRTRPKSRAGAFAAAGLERMGDASHLPLLQEAATCGYAPTERAAKQALRGLGAGRNN